MPCRPIRRTGPTRFRRKRTDSSDVLLRHKTNWRELYESEAARRTADEVIFLQ